MNPEPEGSLWRSIGWMFVGQGAGYLLRVVYFVLIARVLGVVQYGAVAAAFALVGLAAQYSRLGSGMVMLRYVSADRARFSVYWGNVLVTTVVVSGVLTVALRLLAPHILDPRSAVLVVFTAGASCVFEQITIGATQVFQAYQHMRFTASLNLLTSLMRTLAAAGLLLFTHHATAVQWVTLSMLVSGFASVVGVTAVSIKFGRPRFDLKLFRARAGEGVEYAFASSTTSAYDDLDKTMLSHYGMTAAVGIYAMAYRIIEMATMPITSIQLAAEPRLFAFGVEGMQQSAALGRRLLSRSALMSAAIAVVLFVGAPVIPLLVGRSFAEGVSALRWLCLIPLFRSVHHITGSVLTCSGNQRARTVNQMIAAVVNFLTNLWLIPRYGWLGAAWASLFTDALLGALNWTVLKRTLHRNVLTTAQLGPEAANALPLVSIVIPFYKQERFLLEAVRSATQQTYRNVEVIVVDDGSPVPAAAVLEGEPGVTVLRTPNCRVAAARNSGFAASSGEFLVFLDADDILEPTAIQTHVAALLARPDADLSFGAIRTIDANGASLRASHICRPRQDYLRELIVSNPIGCPGAAMIRRSAFARIGGYDARFHMSEDYFFYLNLAATAPLLRLPTCVAAYRQHKLGISRDQPGMLRYTLQALALIEPSLTPAQRRALPHARSRWTHAFSRRPGLLYRLESLYYSFRAMLTVPLPSVFSERDHS